MPEMDGVTLAREIRKRMQTLLILLSSSGEMIVGETLISFDIQIPKPIRRSSLFNALVDIVARESRQPPKKVERKTDSAMATKPIRYEFCWLRITPSISRLVCPCFRA